MAKNSVSNIQSNKNFRQKLLTFLGHQFLKLSNRELLVCWRVVADSFPGFTLEEINNESVEERRYPGTTHLLRRDGDRHVIQVIILQRVIEMIKTGQIKLENLYPS